MAEVKPRQQERVVTFGPNVNTPTQQGYNAPNPNNPLTRK